MFLGDFMTKSRQEGRECRNPGEIEMQSEKEMFFRSEQKRRGVAEMGFAIVAAMIE